MTLGRALLLAVLLGALPAAEASAQMTVGPAQGGGFGAAPPPGAGFGAPQQGPPCMQEFVPLREAAEKGAAAIRAASERKAPREEVCGLFKRFTGLEGKVVKFLEARASSCGIPPKVVAGAKGNHVKTVALTKKICATGQAAAPAAPSLADALGGTPKLPDATTSTKKSTGTFDTLTGNALAR